MPTLASPRSALRANGRTGLALSIALIAAQSLLATGCGAAPPAASPSAHDAPPPQAMGQAEQMAVASGVADGAGDGAGDEERGGVMAVPASAPMPATAPGAAPPAPGAAPRSVGRPAAPSSSAASGKASGAQDEEVAAAPMVVYEGDLALRVDAGLGNAAIDSIVTLAESLGGHLAGRNDGLVVVKIPSRRFREAMSDIDGAFDVEKRSVRAEDVTAEFKDLEVRLENLRATRKRLEHHLEKSATLADTLTLERELERVAAEIDRIQGRLRFLRTHTSFSKLTVAVVERARATTVVAKAPPPAARRDLAIPAAWIDRLGVDALLHIAPDE